MSKDDNKGEGYKGVEDQDNLSVQHLLKLMANMQAQHNTEMKSMASKIDTAMQRQEAANEAMQVQLKQVQEGTKQVQFHTPSAFPFGAQQPNNVTTANAFTFKASAPPLVSTTNASSTPSYVCADRQATGPQNTTPEGKAQYEANGGLGHTEGSNAHHAMVRVAEALEKTLITPKQTARLPYFCLPKLIKTESDMVTCGNFFSWRKKCLQLIEEHNISESVSVHLLQGEESLPRRFKSAINNCTSVQSCFETLQSMVEPLQSLFHQLVQKLTSVDACYDHEGQIKTLDSIIQILLQLDEHFPTKDIDFGHLTATLSAFSGPAQLTQLPALLSEFQEAHYTTHQKYTTLLYTYCIKRRTDLYVVMAAMSVYRPDQVDNN